MQTSTEQLLASTLDKRDHLHTALRSKTDAREDQYYSLCFQRHEPLSFYSLLLQKTLSFAKSFDEGTPISRENVWKRFYSLLGEPISKTKDDNTFAPLLSHWLKEPSINLFAIEMLFISFITTTTTSGNMDLLQPLQESSNIDKKAPFSPWGHTLPETLFQLLLLQHWESKLEKLSVVHKKMILNLCNLIPTFSYIPETSFRKTISTWNEDPIQHMPSITIFFSAIGFLKEHGVLKSEFCFPKTTIPVFQSFPHEIPFPERSLSSSSGNNFSPPNQLAESKLKDHSTYTCPHTSLSSLKLDNSETSLVFRNQNMKLSQILQATHTNNNTSEILPSIPPALLGAFGSFESQQEFSPLPTQQKRKRSQCGEELMRRLSVTDSPEKRTKAIMSINHLLS